MPQSMKRPAGKVPVKKKPASQSGSAGSTVALRDDASPMKESIRKSSGSKKPAHAKPRGRLASKKQVAAKKPVAVKKPAAARKSGRRASTGSDLRDRLLASIPAKLKRRYKGGCCTCRYRPLCCNSCWFKRGFFI